jgi:hypothetical protein
MAEPAGGGADSRSQALRGSELALLLLGAGQHAVSSVGIPVGSSRLMDSVTRLSVLTHGCLAAVGMRLDWVMTAMRGRRRRRRRARC